MTARQLVEVVYTDLQTHSRKDELLPYAELIKCVADLYLNSEVKADATAEGLYNLMLENARKNQKNGSFAYSHEQSIEFCKKYLGINGDSAVLHLNAKIGMLNLEDFF